jgi:hypothetical protein
MKQLEKNEKKEILCEKFNICRQKFVNRWFQEIILVSIDRGEHGGQNGRKMVAYI